jgi:phosphatidylglycerol:prolipoprotein diacylglycerol transferase
MFDIPPDPVALQLGPITIGWYGLCYAIGLAAAYIVLVRLARAAGEDPDLVGNGIIVISVAALIGGRLYHVIDQWALYANDPVKIVLPPYSGLGVYGGIVTGTLAGWWYTRRRGVSFVRWADIVAPALFVMQAIGRWGNYFNQELYGPPTDAPWGIPIDCAHRLAAYACETLPETTRFHPLFLYESISGLFGAAFLVFLGYRLRSWLRPGDLLLVFFIWYGVTRFVLEYLREDNWTFFDVPTAQIVSLAFIAVGVGGLIVRHRRSRMGDRPPTEPQVATWGALGAAWMTRPIDEPWANVGTRPAAEREERAADESGVEVDEAGGVVGGEAGDEAADAADAAVDQPGVAIEVDAAREPGRRPTP